MTVMESSEVPVLAQPRRPEGRMGFRQFLRAIRDNALATHKSENFSADIVTNRILWRRTFIINEPNSIRHVLLDNAANYTKSEVGRRLLDPGLGRGLLTSEGETWRRHRRIMAPAFDPRSIAGYAPIMTRRHRSAAGKMGRTAGAARSRRGGGDDAGDAAYHLARDVLV